MKTVGLVLGSGGARGWAHIGVIRALEAANIKINYIAGASIGALVGAIYSAGELDDLEELVRALDWKAVVSYFDLVFPSTGLLDGNRVYELLSDHLQDLAIEDANIPFCCVATDLGNGQEVRLDSGPMVDAVRASISIPGVFTPFQKGDRFFGDGGIINPMPVDVMQDMGADLIIAVNLNNAQVPAPRSRQESGTSTTPSEVAVDEPSESSQQSDASQPQPCSSPKSNAGESASNQSKSEQPQDSQSLSQQQLETSALFTVELSSARSRITGLIEKVQQRYEVIQDQVQEKVDSWMPEQKQGMNIFDVIGASLNVMEQQVTLSKLEACPPDILVEPALSDYGIFDFHQADAIIQEGYRCMSDCLPDLQKCLSEPDD